MANKDRPLDSLIAVFLICFVCSDVWHWVADSRIRYAIQYDVSTHDVSVAKRPSSRDFLYAPIGSKDCKFEKNVSVAIRGNDVQTGRKIISFNNGKTWNWDDGDELVGTTVDVQWAKEDQ